MVSVTLGQLKTFLVKYVWENLQPRWFISVCGWVCLIDTGSCGPAHSTPKPLTSLSVTPPPQNMPSLLEDNEAVRQHFQNPRPDLFNFSKPWCCVHCNLMMSNYRPPEFPSHLSSAQITVREYFSNWDLLGFDKQGCDWQDCPNLSATATTWHGKYEREK